MVSRYVKHSRRAGNLNTKTIGRPVGCVAVHPHEEFVILKRILRNPKSTLVEICEEIVEETGSFDSKKCMICIKSTNAVYYNGL